MQENGAYIQRTARANSQHICKRVERGLEVRTCLLSTMLAGRTRCTSAPSDRSALTFSSATSSGIIIASTEECKHAGPPHQSGKGTYSCHSPCERGSSSRKRRKRQGRLERYLAFDIVAIEIPVDPTVPSKIREPVCGCNNPCRSASSITMANT